MKALKKEIILAAILMTAPIFLSAQSQITGLEVMEKVYNRPEGEDMEGKLTMTLTNSRGESRVRKIEQSTRDFGKIEKKIMFFLYPADVRNTSFMTWGYDEAGKDDDQWIYLPALKKVKRISSESKSDYFMGSDFTYDDLGDRHPEEDNHRILREETVQGQPSYVVESTPKDEDYIYSKTISWVIKDKWIGLKKDFYDEDGDLLKTLAVQKYEEISGFWIILHSRMHNVQKNHTTDMELQDVKINSGVNAGMFTTRIMMRGVR